jgi:integrase
LIAALLAVLLVEFLSPRPRPEPQYPQPIIQIAYPALMDNDPRRLAGAATALPGPAQALLSLATTEPSRELTIGEVYALWNAATRNGRLAIAALFSGLTLDELTALSWRDVDLQTGHVRVPDGRLQLLAPPLTQELQDRASGQPPTAAVAATSTDAPLSTSDLAGLIAAAAHDSGIDQAGYVDADALRHTYVCFLVRQGVRLSELDRIVGPLPPASFLFYRAVAPRGAAIPVAAVNRSFPAFSAL